MIRTNTAKAVEPNAGPQHSAARRVLVAEDSTITHDLLKLLLNQRGHEVDIAMDGLEALAALREKKYDVALLDYHLPNMDGLQVAAALKAEALTSGHRLPRLIAITADPEGLLSAESGCEKFDYILPKPLDINQVGKVVEEQADIADREGADKAEPVEQLPASAVTPLPPILDGMGHKLLAWPDDLDASRFTSRAMQATLGDVRFDALVIKVPVSPDDLATIWERKALYALPVIDLTGSLGGRADLDASSLDPHERDRVERLIRRFKERRARLHRDLLLSDDLEDRLLGRIFVTGKPLTATLDSGSPSCVAYNITMGENMLARETERMRAKGLLKREFVERFHVCGRCQSSRIHARDACVKCRSPNLSVEEYIHHFRCGFQGPKSQFRRGLELVCPKCHHELDSIGIDFGPVETMFICQSCGHADAKAPIGMVCLDCDAHYEWGNCRERDVFSYQLTDQGSGFAEYGRSFLGLFQKPLRFEELPKELILALNDAAKKFNDDKTPFTLVNIFYKNERAIASEHGGRQFAGARNQFIENLRTALGNSELVVRGPSSYDFALLPGVDPQQATRGFPNLRQRAAGPLSLDLGATLKAFGPEDF
jgi:CheY-like chemotaxis protein